MLTLEQEAEARAIAEHSLEAEFPKYRDDPSIYRHACDGAVTNLCKRRGILARNIVIKIQNSAWNAVYKTGADMDVKEVLRIANDEISAIHEGNTAAETISQELKRIGKVAPVILARGENTVRRKEKPVTAPDGAPLPATGPVTGGPFGSKQLTKAEINTKQDFPFEPEADPKNTPVVPPAAVLRDDHTLEDFLDPQPPTTPASIDDKPKCLNDWALDRDKRELFIQKVDGLAFEAMIDAKHARAWGLAILNVPDETQIAMSANDAIRTIKAAMPNLELPQSEPVIPPAVEIVKSEEKPVTPANLPEASVIVFAKSDIYLTLPNGATIVLSVTLRDGASFEEVKRLLDVYAQMLSLPNVSTARPAPLPVASPTVPDSTPRPAAPVVPAQPQTGGEVKTDVVGAIMPAMTEKGELTWKLFPRLGNGTVGKYPCYTVKAARDNERIPLDAICATEGIQLTGLPVGQMYMFNAPLFSISHKQGNPMKDDPNKHYRDFVSITAL